MYIEFYRFRKGLGFAQLFTRVYTRLDVFWAQHEVLRSITTSLSE